MTTHQSLARASTPLLSQNLSRLERLPSRYTSYKLPSTHQYTPKLSPFEISTLDQKNKFLLTRSYTLLSHSHTPSYPHLYQSSTFFLPPSHTQVTAEDPDVSFNAEVRYSIAMTDGPFTINPDTGTVSTVMTLYTHGYTI